MKNLDAYKLKWIAIIGMILSHMVIAWWDIIPAWLRVPMYATGGLTFPIMAYFVVEGYKHTSNIKRYILRVLMFGLIALPFHILALGIPLAGGNPSVYPWLNIMFAIALSLLVLVLYDKIKSRVVFWILYIVLIVPISFLFLEWDLTGVTMVLLFYIIRNENARRIVPPIFAGLSNLGALLLLTISLPLMQNLEGFQTQGLAFNMDFIRVMPVFVVGCLLASFLLYNYNGERGKRMKYLFYVMYPVHFIVLAGVGLALELINIPWF